MSVIHFSIQNTNILPPIYYCMLIDLYTVVEHVAMQRTAKMQKQNQEIMQDVSSKMLWKHFSIISFPDWLLDRYEL